MGPNDGETKHFSHIHVVLHRDCEFAGMKKKTCIFTAYGTMGRKGTEHLNIAGGRRNPHTNEMEYL